MDLSTIKKRKLVAPMMMSLWLLPVSSAWGFVQPEAPAQKGFTPLLVFKEQVLRTSTENDPSNKFSSSGASQLKRDRISGETRLLSGKIPFNMGLELSADSLEAACLTYVDAHPEIFGVSSKDLNLLKNSFYFGKEEQFLKFGISRNGLMVFDASIDFRFKMGNLVQIANHSFSEAKLVNTEARIDLDEIAEAETGAESINEGQFLYRVRAHKDSYELVKVKEYQIQTFLGQRVSIQLEAESGEVFQLKNKEYHVSKAQAQVHPRWHNENLEVKPLPYLKVDTGDGSKVSDSQGNFESTQNQAPSINGLRGTFVEISPSSGGKISKTAVAAEDGWLIDLAKPGDDSAWLDKFIAQTMVYYHTNLIILKAKEYITNDWLNETLTANVNLTRTCNAHWDGDTINLYSGNSQCANTGIIADVIYHEWGHGLDTKTGGIVDGAFSEGYGDIMSLLMTGSSQLGIGFRIPSNGPVRDLEPNKIYPDDRGEVHAEGLIIGSTFWDLFLELQAKHSREEALDILANYAFKMIFTADRYTEVYDAILVIDDDDGNLENGTPHKCILNKVFTEHGLANEELTCKLAAPEEFQLNDTDGDGYIEPSETISIKVLAKNSSPATLAGLNGSISLKAGNDIVIESSDISWADIASGEAKLSDTSASIKISETAQCGSSFKLGLKLFADSREVTSEHTFSIGKNLGEAQSFSGTDLPAPITDFETTTSSTSVSSDDWGDETTVNKAHLKFFITHTYQGDIRVKLIAPDGQEFEIFKGNGNTDDVDFDQDITDIISGVKGLGDWTLSVYDKARRDTGTLDEFSLTLTPNKFVCD
ncbi:MAG: proprotein convertase P-domain-containing protein [Oligoflexales bacterium]